MKKFINILLAVIISASFVLNPIAAEPTKLNLNKIAFVWNDRSIISKESWILKGKDSISVAEFAVVMDNLMKLQGGNPTPNTNPEEWYVNYMLKAENANLLVSASRQLNPFDALTREDAVVIFARAIGVKVDYTEADSGFTDSLEISPSSIPYIRAMYDMGNLPFKGEFKPNELITKEEFLTMLDLTISDIYNAARVYTNNINDSLVINAEGVTLKNIVINENLIISEGVKSGTITLDNVLVKGQTVIRGSKEVVVKNSSLPNVLVENRGNSTLFNVDYRSTVNNLEAIEARDGLMIQGPVSNIDLHNAQGTLAMIGGRADFIQAAEELKIFIDANSKVKNITLGATKSKVEVGGTVNSVVAGESANENVVTVLETGVVQKLTKRTDTLVDLKGKAFEVIELPAYIPPPDILPYNFNVTNMNSAPGEIYLGTFISTAYCTENYPHICSGPTAKTATGTKPIPYKTIAVDPKVIPLGSKLKVLDDLTGKIYYVTATDTGGAIKGNIIDMAVGLHQDAINWGRRPIQVWKVP